MKLTYKEKMRQVGLNIAYYRKYRKLTQMELAEKVHVSSCYISQIERNLVGSVSLVVLMSIAEVLEVEIGKLFEFKDMPTQGKRNGQ